MTNNNKSSLWNEIKKILANKKNISDFFLALDSMYSFGRNEHDLYALFLIKYGNNKNFKELCDLFYTKNQESIEYKI